jgi:hypothetical protein
MPIRLRDERSTKVLERLSVPPSLLATADEVIE